MSTRQVKRSVRLAAKANNIAIVVLLVCVTALVVGGLVSSVSGGGRTPDTVAGVFFGLAVTALVVMLGSGFHIAVTDALQRMERRARNDDSDDGL